MPKQIKFLLLFGDVISSFTFAATAPIVYIYFVKLITPDTLAFSNMLGLGIAAVVNHSVTIDKIKKIYRKYFLLIVITDVVCFAVVCFTSLDNANIRFIGYAIMSAFSTNLWCTILADSINNTISGDELTKWSSYARSICLYAALGGALSAMIFTNINITVCLALQVASTLIMAFTDLYAYKLLGGPEMNKGEEGVELV